MSEATLKGCQRLKDDKCMHGHHVVLVFYQQLAPKLGNRRVRVAVTA